MEASWIGQLYDELGDRVRSQRHRLGWSQEKLGIAIGLSRASVANVEAGRQRLAIHQLLSLAHAMRLSLTDLVPEVDIPERFATAVDDSEAALHQEMRLKILSDLHKEG